MAKTKISYLLSTVSEMKKKIRQTMIILTFKSIDRSFICKLLNKIDDTKTNWKYKKEYFTN